MRFTESGGQCAVDHGAMAYTPDDPYWLPSPRLHMAIACVLRAIAWGASVVAAGASWVADEVEGAR